MSHTPGPWECDDENQICARDEVIATVHPRGRRHVDEWDANSRLIAAAPYLLRAAYIAHGMLKRQLVEGMAPDSWGDDEHEAFNALGDVIKEAEGK